MRIQPQTPVSAPPTPFHDFYCRFGNRVLPRCPQACGPEACPVRGECPAYAPAPPPPPI